MTSIEVNNPSAFRALRIYSQDRARNVINKAPPAAPASKRHTREELQAIGNEIVMVSSRGTALVNGAPQSVTRDVPTPFYKTAGYETLAEFCTESQERELREYQQHVAKAALSPSRGERVVDEWSAPKPFESIAPHAKLHLPLDESKRFLVECDEEVALQLSNTSSVRTIRLRNRNAKTGETVHVAFIPPAREYPQAALIMANGNSAACIELMPS